MYFRDSRTVTQARNRQHVAKRGKMIKCEEHIPTWLAEKLLFHHAIAEPPRVVNLFCQLTQLLRVRRPAGGDAQQLSFPIGDFGQPEAKVDSQH